MLMLSAQYLHSGGNLRAGSNINAAENAIGAYVNTRIDRRFRMSEKRSEGDAAIERTSLKSEAVKCDPKIIPGKAGQQRVAVREDPIEETDFPETADQSGWSRQ